MLLSSSYIQQQVVQNIFECSRNCDATHNCEGYNFNDTNKTCTLLRDVSFKVPYDTSKQEISYQYVIGNEQPTLFQNSYIFKDNASYMFHSSTSNTVFARNVSQCQIACDSSFGCQGYNYLDQSSSCTLLYNISMLKTVNPLASHLKTGVQTSVPNITSFVSKPFLSVRNTSFLLYPDIANINIQNISNISSGDECIMQCDKDYACKAMNYNASIHQCSLFIQNNDTDKIQLLYEPIDTHQIHHYAYNETLVPLLKPIEYNTVTNSSYQLYTKTPLFRKKCFERRSMYFFV